VTESSVVPEPVRVFLRAQIESYEELEVLLLVREQRGRWCSASQIGALGSATLMAPAEALERLYRRGLLAVRDEPPDVRYQYDPSDRALVERVDELALVYRDNPLEVMKLMTQNAVERVRSQAARTLIVRSGRRSDPGERAAGGERVQGERALAAKKG
jgi:hypothetical protein